MSDMEIPLHTTRNIVLQFFLTEDPVGVCEVGPEQIPSDPGTEIHRLRCTCSNWSEEETCTHCVYVAARILDHEDLSYPAAVHMPIQNTGLSQAMRDPHLMRHWLVHHAKVVID